MPVLDPFRPGLEKVAGPVLTDALRHILFIVAALHHDAAVIVKEVSGIRRDADDIDAGAAGFSGGGFPGGGFSRGSFLCGSFPGSSFPRGSPDGKIPSVAAGGIFSDHVGAGHDPAPVLPLQQADADRHDCDPVLRAHRVYARIRSEEPFLFFPRITGFVYRRGRRCSVCRSDRFRLCRPGCGRLLCGARFSPCSLRSGSFPGRSCHLCLRLLPRRFHFHRLQAFRPDRFLRQALQVDPFCRIVEKALCRRLIPIYRIADLDALSHGDPVIRSQFQPEAVFIESAPGTERKRFPVYLFQRPAQCPRIFKCIKEKKKEARKTCRQQGCGGLRDPLFAVCSE